jgi:hypothetical protein
MVMLTETLLLNLQFSKASTAPAGFANSVVITSSASTSVGAGGSILFHSVN